MTLVGWQDLPEKVSVIIEARNKYGAMKVAEKFKEPVIYNGREFEWSKHIDVLDVWESGEWWRIKKANNRQILECEIILDVDPEKDETPMQIKQRTKNIIDSLNESNIPHKAFFTGSKGYHIHIIVPRLPFYDPRIRKIIRERMIKFYGCDIQKASDNTMIAMEHCPHWKTGNKKEVVSDEHFKQYN